MNGTERLPIVLHHALLALSMAMMFLVVNIWWLPTLGNQGVAFWTVGIAIPMFLFGYGLWELVLFRDALRSTYTVVAAPIDRLLAEVETILEEEGRYPRRRPPGTVPPHSFRWTEVLDLEDGLTVHLRALRQGTQVFVGPLGSDNREEVVHLLDLFKRGRWGFAPP